MGDASQSMDCPDHHRRIELKGSRKIQQLRGMVVEYLNISGKKFFSSKTSIHSKRLGRDGDERLKDQDGQDHIKLEPRINPIMQVEKTQQLTEKDKETPKNLWECCLCCHHHQNKECRSRRKQIWEWVRN